MYHGVGGGGGWGTMHYNNVIRFSAAHFVSYCEGKKQAAIANYTDPKMILIFALMVQIWSTASKAFEKFKKN